MRRLKNEMKSIGKNVAMMLPTIESWSMFGVNQIIVVLPVDVLKWRKDREYVRYRDLFLPKSKDKEKEIGWEKVVVPNSGFTVSLFPNYEENPRYHYYAKSYCDVHLVKLEHPALEKYPFTIATYVDGRNLINMMAKSRNILEGTLSGNFCCIHTNNTSGIWYTVFDVEDPEDAKMEEEKILGKIISEGKNTTKWKIGYQYITKNERTFIYLGDIKGGWLKPCYGSGFGDALPYGFSCSVEKVEETLSLILDTTSLKPEDKDLLNSGKGGWVSTFINSYLTYLILSGLGRYRNYLRTIRRSTHPAVEVEEIFKDDGKDLKNLILDFYTARYPKVTGYELMVKYEDLEGIGKSTMENEIKNRITSYVDNRRSRSSYYGSSTASLDLSTANNPEKLLAFLNSNKPSYRYYGNDIYNVLDYIGEDEFKRIAGTCTFS